MVHPFYITASNLLEDQQFSSSSNPGLSSATRNNYTKLWDAFKISICVVHQWLTDPSCSPKCLYGVNLLHSEQLSWTKPYSTGSMAFEFNSVCTCRWEHWKRGFVPFQPQKHQHAVDRIWPKKKSDNFNANNEVVKKCLLVFWLQHTFL